jgi:hypothetical protein
LTARREEDLGGGRASWLVPSDVISLNTDKPPATGKREKKQGGSRSLTPPLLKVPPPAWGKEKREEKRLRKREREGEGRAGEKKDVDERKK